MNLPNFIDAVMNERTEKWFMVLDRDVGDNKFKVINPLGDVLDVVKLIFKVEDMRQIAKSDYEKFFSKEQIAKLGTWEHVSHAVEQKKKLERAAKASQQPSERGSKTKKEGLIDRSANLKRPVAQWACPELTFYRHRIENLKPNEVFAVQVEGIGIFQITKAEFQRSFNNVILNTDYRTQGVYRYDTFPEEARKFLIPS
jgi:hypothetical protein